MLASFEVTLDWGDGGVSCGVVFWGGGGGGGGGFVWLWVGLPQVADFCCGFVVW